MEQNPFKKTWIQKTNNRLMITYSKNTILYVIIISFLPILICSGTAPIHFYGFNSYLPGTKISVLLDDIENRSQLITINNNSYYISKIPFYDPQLGTPEDPNALPLGSAQTYTPTFFVDDVEVNISIDQRTFVYGRENQGLIKRIDLVSPSDTEPFEEWSLRHFNRVLDTTERQADADNDAHSNFHEYLTGTDPNDPTSFSLLISLEPTANGGFVINFSTVEGRYYDILQSTDLQTWTTASEGIIGNGSPKAYSAPDVLTQYEKLFYKIVAKESPSD